MYNFKNFYSAPNWSSWAAWPRPSPRAEVRSASARIFESSAGTMANGLCYTLLILNVVRSNATYPFLVSPVYVHCIHFYIPSTSSVSLLEYSDTEAGVPYQPHDPLAICNILVSHFRSLYLKPATVNCVGSVKPPKKAGRPVIIELNPNFEILSQMRNLQITFLNDDGQCSFSSVMELHCNDGSPSAFSLTALVSLDCKSFCQLLSTDLTIG